MPVAVHNMAIYPANHKERLSFEPQAAVSLCPIKVAKDSEHMRIKSVLTGLAVIIFIAVIAWMV
ncbi:MAG: hypothetical protein ACYDCX_12260 [Acidithiobacillus sp.]